MLRFCFFVDTLLCDYASFLFNLFCTAVLRSGRFLVYVRVFLSVLLLIYLIVAIVDHDPTFYFTLIVASLEDTLPFVRSV